MSDSDQMVEIDLPTGGCGVPSTTHTTQGPAIPPQQRLLLYSPDEWEEFINEWAHYCLKSTYTKVQRFSGSGDKGIDVAGFADEKRLIGKWDSYQCKHYDHSLYPSDLWREIGKVLWFSFKGDYIAPQHHYFVAPRGVGTSASALLSDRNKLKVDLISNWDKHCRTKITDTQKIELSGNFKTYVEKFPFEIFDHKTPLEIIEAHSNCPMHAIRFGGGIGPRTAPDAPPQEIAPIESRYIRHLLDAYEDHKHAQVNDISALTAWPPLNRHFTRQRVAFYHAESLRVFARDTVPPGTFESLQEDIFDGVVDTHDDNHVDGFARVKAVTQAARELQITANPLITEAGPKDRDGICHQLANEDRLKWRHD